MKKDKTAAAANEFAELLRQFAIAARDALQFFGVKPPTVTLIVHADLQRPHSVTIGRSREEAIDAILRVAAALKSLDPLNN